MNNTIRYKPLPSKLYMVRVPIVCTYSAAELDILGAPLTVNTVTGDIVNKKAYHDLTTCMLPLTKIIDIYAGGYPIYIVNRTDNVEIFNTLEEYLAGVINAKSGYMLNTPTVIEERLEDIEKFAQEMFGLNKGDIVRGTINLSNQGMGGLGLDIMKPQPMSTYNVNDGQPIHLSRPTQHTSYPLPQEDIKKHEEQHPQVRRPIPSNTNYGYVNNSLPDFNLDEVKRRSTYRKVYKG